MKKLVPFKTLFGRTKKLQSLSETSVVVDEQGIPQGFVFGRDAFISFLEHIDQEFEKRAVDQQRAYDNPAGKLIDLIEDKLPLRKSFVRELQKSIRGTKKTDWIPFDDVVRALNV
jgi:hypothetical protein